MISNKPYLWSPSPIQAYLSNRLTFYGQPKARGGQAALDFLDAGMRQLGVQGQLQDKAIRIELSRGNQLAALERMRSLGEELQRNPFWRVDYAAMLLDAKKGDQARSELKLAADTLAQNKQSDAVKKLLIRIDLLGQKAATI